jgi:hypothetical protein
MLYPVNYRLFGGKKEGEISPRGELYFAKKIEGETLLMILLKES